MSRKHTSRLNENGFASIVIALVFIIILALLTVGFAQLARREQQNALDKQLASQANYAAESGINAAFRDIKNGYITTNGAPKAGIPSVKSDNQNCMPASNDSHAATYAATSGISHPVNSNNGVTYSCLLVTLQTTNLVSNNVLPGTGRHMNFSTQSPLNSLTIYWGSASANNKSFPGNVSSTDFPTLNNWQDSSNRRYPPVIEFSITPVNALPGQADPLAYLTNNTFNFFLYPSSSGSNTVTFNPANQGQKVAGDCDPNAAASPNTPDPASYPCKVVLNGLNSQNYVIHFTDYYDASNLYIDGTTTVGAAQFTGEPIIDVTGKARNVLKRLQARLFLNGGTNGQPNDNTPLPNGALEAQNICKRIQAAPSTTDFPQGSTYDGATDASCNLSN